MALVREGSKVGSASDTRGRVSGEAGGLLTVSVRSCASSHALRLSGALFICASRKDKQPFCRTLIPLRVSPRLQQPSLWRKSFLRCRSAFSPPSGRFFASASDKTADSNPARKINKRGCCGRVARSLTCAKTICEGEWKTARVALQNISNQSIALSDYSAEVMSLEDAVTSGLGRPRKDGVVPAAEVETGRLKRGVKGAPYISVACRGAVQSARGCVDTFSAPWRQPDKAAPLCRDSLRVARHRTFCPRRNVECLALTTPVTALTHVEASDENIARQVSALRVETMRQVQMSKSRKSEPFEKEGGKEGWVRDGKAIRPFSDERALSLSPVTVPSLFCLRWLWSVRDIFPVVLKMRNTYLEMEHLSREQLFNECFRSDQKTMQEQVCNYMTSLLGKGMQLRLSKNYQLHPLEEQQDLKKARTSGISPTLYTNEKAFALFIDAQLTTHQYKLIQSQAKEISCQSAFKQRLSKPIGEDSSDEHLFVISCVPFQLHTNESQRRILRQKPQTIYEVLPIKGETGALSSDVLCLLSSPLFETTTSDAKSQSTSGTETDETGVAARQPRLVVGAGARSLQPRGIPACRALEDVKIRPPPSTPTRPTNLMPLRFRKRHRKARAESEISPRDWEAYIYRLSFLPLLPPTFLHPT
ncbi:hypothetical protein PR048_020240 [Dryococelus australis]|uniref:Uncharacterized protein n=1 Tax=Dryococelus australis TaxID=614101 RepID=A0ABQ9H5R1_9NEOP|nr:hypothetical protein PR048_020240 [Dryococelus australis]